MALWRPLGGAGARLRYVTERRGFLATLLISPAVLFIAALVGAPLVLAIYLSFTDAHGRLADRRAGSASRNFRNAAPRPDLPRRALAHVPLHA